MGLFGGGKGLPKASVKGGQKGPSKKEAKKAKAAAREQALQHVMSMSTDGPKVLETAAELALEAFLRPFGLEEKVDAVFALAAAGYSSVESLRALDDDALRDLGTSLF